MQSVSDIICSDKTTDFSKIGLHHQTTARRTEEN